VKHELWVDSDGLDGFSIAGPLYEDQRQLNGPGATLAWTVDADSHFDAMTRYYEYKGWGTYTTDFPEIDRMSYKDRGME
jgi:hypothetical protein